VKCKRRLLDLLNADRVTYILHPLDGGGAQSDADSPAPATVTLAFRSGRPVLLITAAGRQPDLGAISRVLGRADSRLALPSELHTLFPDCEHGAMPPIGALYGLPVFLDSDLAREHDITFLTGTRSESLTMSMRAFEHLTWPVHATLTIPVASAA
jgi:prolyl-tRNA editing enzyme YbaK/EbsC (Cys-tRNA(Pro) deacylase)